MRFFRAIWSALDRVPPLATWSAIVVMVGASALLLISNAQPTHNLFAGSITATPVDTSTAIITDTSTVDPLATATDTPLPGPTNTPDPLATATNTPQPPPPTPTPTIVSYQAPLLPVEITLSPTSLSGVCAQGKLPEIAVTQTGGTDPIGWNAAASPRMDLNPGNSSANGDNPMVPGKPQYIGFSFGNSSLSSGTVITITVQQTQLTVPEQTRDAGTVTVHCQ